MVGNGTKGSSANISCVILICLVSPVVAAAQAVSGIKVPAGFEVTKVAGDDLATNIY